MRGRTREIPWLLLTLALLPGACADEASGPPRVIDLATAAPPADAPALVAPPRDGGEPPNVDAGAATPSPGDDEGDATALRVHGGALSPETVQRTIERARPALQRCIDTARGKRPGLRGTLVLAFKVKNSGAVAWAKAVPASTVQDPGLERCSVALFKRLRFGKFKGASAFVTYPVAVE